MAEEIAQPEEGLFEKVEAGIRQQIQDNVARLNTALDATIATAHDRFKAGIEFFLQHDKKIIVALHTEVSIFKRLEAHMRAGTLTEEVVNETLSDLDEHRENVRKANEAARASEAK